MTDPSGEPNLREYMRMVWRRRRLVFLIVVVAVGSSLVASLASDPVYQASARLVLQNQTADVFTDATVPQLNPDRTVQTEIEVFDGSAVKSRVEELIGVAPPVKVTSLGQTNAFAVTARAPEADEAALIANAYAIAYVDVTRDQSLSDIEAAITQIQSKIDDLQTQIQELDAQPPGPGTDSQRDTLVSNQAVFRQKLDQLQVSASLQSGRAKISSPAKAPSSPVEPQPVRSAVLALVAGAIIGLGTALLLEYLNDSITTPESLERALQGIPVLGTIPLTASSRRHPVTIASLDDPASPAAEAYRSLRTAVQFIGFDREHNLIQITSPSQADGKTTTAVNLAVALAGVGQRVCLSDCDLRRPSVHELLEIDGSVGLTSVITGASTLPKAVQRLRSVPGLHVLPAGPLPPNPAEVLASRHAREVLEALRDRYDVVVVDCPPLLPVTDAVALAPTVDAVLLVARSGSTRTHDAQRALDMLRQVHVQPAGAVLNATTIELGGYGYGYGTPPPPPQQPRGDRVEA